jgi:large subunit ribosomal protein L5
MSNPMKEISLEKMTLNIGAGEPGPKLEKSQKILEIITGNKVVITKTRKRTTFGGAKNRPIGVMTTMRGAKAEELLKRLVQAVEEFRESQFDRNGNFSFGIKEYIHIPGVKYDPDIGILGMDVCVTLTRPGYRVSRRRIRPARQGKNHMITKEEGIEWAKKELGLKIGK